MLELYGVSNDFCLNVAKRDDSRHSYDENEMICDFLFDLSMFCLNMFCKIIKIKNKKIVKKTGIDHQQTSLLKIKGMDHQETSLMKIKGIDHQPDKFKPTHVTFLSIH